MTYVDMFTMFVREQEHLKASASHQGGIGITDVATLIESQRSHRCALQFQAGVLVITFCAKVFATETMRC